MELRPTAGVSGRGQLSPVEPLVFEFTRDPALLRQYHAIYEREFRIVHGVAGYRHVEDEHDRRGHVLVVRQGDACVGGGRLSAKTSRKPDPLPIEMDDFRIEDHFPYLRERQLSYGQLGRICLLPEFRDGRVARLMFWHMYRKAFALGLAEVFGTSTLIGARTYKRYCRAIGLGLDIFRDVALPEYPMCEGIRFYLIRTVLGKGPRDVPPELMRAPAREDA